MDGGFREEVLNVGLAGLLGRRGLVSTPETIQRGEHGRRLPDVVVAFRGLRVLLEGKINDVPGARGVVTSDARRRVDEGLAHIAIATVYPSRLRRVEEFADLDRELAAARLDVRIATENGTGPWVRVNGVDGLVDLLVRTYEQLVREDVVDEAVGLVEGGIDAFAREVRSIPAGADRIAALLEVGEPEEIDEDADAE